MSESECVVRSMHEADLEMVLAWRNHADVRKMMLTQHVIQLDEHRRWYEHARNNPSRCMLVVERDGLPVGFVHFSGATAGGVADWGFYAAPDAPSGSGSCICRAALDHVFHVLKVHKVCGQVLACNKVSNHLHRKLGFVEEGVLREQQMITDGRQDLVCFGLLRREWLDETG